MKTRIFLLRQPGSTPARNQWETQQDIRACEVRAADVIPAGSLDLLFEEGEVRGEVWVQEAGLHVSGDAARDGFDEEGDWGCFDGFCD